MRAAGRVFVIVLSLVVAFLVDDRGAKAAPILSDRLVISDLATGAVLYDATIDELSEGEGDLGFAADLPLTDDCCFLSAVILTEPPGEPPGEDAVFVPGTDLVASDLVIFNTSVDQAGVPQMLVEAYLFSDGYYNFENYVKFGYAPPGSPLLEETGSLQDLTDLLHSDVAGWRVQVQSDVVPEPGTLPLLAAGLVGMAARARRARRSRSASA